MKYPLPDNVLFVLKELSSWKLESDSMPEDGIRELHIEFTHRCNLKCPMCHHWQMKPGKELSVKEFERVITSSSLLNNVRTVALSGGEPFLRNDVGELAAMLKKHFPQMHFGVLSNFFAPKLVLRRVKEIQAAGIENFWLGTSLDGIGEAHDRMRGTPGAYANFLETAAALRSAHPDINFGANFTITPQNAEQLFDTYLVMKGRNIWLGAQLVVQHEDLPGQEYRWTAALRKSAARQIECVIADICASNSAFERIVSGREAETPWLWAQLIYWKNLRDYVLKPQRLFGHCLAGYRYAMLAPDGKLFFCPVKKHLQAGDAFASGLDSVWNGETAAKLRSRFDRRQCHCWLHCIANPIIENTVGTKFSGGGKK